MSFLPDVEIGVWNTWIFMVAWVFFHMVPLDWPIFRYDYKAQFKKSAAYPPPNKSEKIMNNLGTAILIILIIYSIFLPLPSGTPLLYAGIALFLVGLIISVVARISWRTTPIDEPITKGLYKYSRHPIYIGVFVQYIGICIASASWLFLLLMTVHIFLAILCVPAEERYCLKKYGETYLKYLNRTPRWIGMPKS